MAPAQEKKAPMSDLRLKLACWDYDRTRPLIDGRVQAEGIDLDIKLLRPRHRSRKAGPAVVMFHGYSGNAGEWVEDCYNQSLNGAPKDGTAWLDGDCNKRVVRGGSWHDERHYLAAYREPSPVGDRNNDIGIRLVKSLPE